MNTEPSDHDQPMMVMLSPDVADFLRQILDTVSLPVAAPNFAEQAAKIVKAKEQLATGSSDL